MFEGHDPYLVALSVVIAILGGYTGFGLAARIRGTPGVSQRVLLSGLAGNFAIQHDGAMILLSIGIAIVAAYGGLRAFLARQDGIRLIASSVAFGVAVSGMHYTAMFGMHFVPLSEATHQHAGGLAAS